jgi:hypothetical protein
LFYYTNTLLLPGYFFLIKIAAVRGVELESEEMQKPGLFAIIEYYFRVLPDLNTSWDKRTIFELNDLKRVEE